MTTVSIIGLILIAVNCLVSYRGLKNHVFFDDYKFEIDKILISKDYKRLLTSGFLHVSWSHLLFNMLSLFLFSAVLENYLGAISFIAIYFSGLIGGNLLALFVHRHHGDYSSAGASGAICGVIFACIALFPDLGIGLLGLPLSIPGWLYGLLYVLYSIYGIRSEKDNIGHEAHLGGAVIGMITAIIIHPEAFTQNYFTILIIFFPAVVFVYLIITRPHKLLIHNFYHKSHSTYYDIDHKYNEERANRQKELDHLLDKVHQKGFDGLSKREKERLKELSK
jgi:membrane associated rhomboid family serine protease